MGPLLIPRRATCARCCEPPQWLLQVIAVESPPPTSGVVAFGSRCDRMSWRSAGSLTWDAFGRVSLDAPAIASIDTGTAPSECEARNAAQAPSPARFLHSADGRKRSLSVFPGGPERRRKTDGGRGNVIQKVIQWPLAERGIFRLFLLSSGR